MNAQRVDAQALAFNAVVMGSVVDMQIRRSAPMSAVTVEVSISVEDLHFCIEHSLRDSPLE